MSRTSALGASPEWITATEAKSIVGCVGQAALMRLVILGQIRVRNDPGVLTRYHREDCLCVAQARQGALHPVGA